MPNFSNRSKRRLAQCDDRLQEILNKAIELVDFSILEGHRDEEKQNRMVAEGKSQLSWPNSRHNKNPSLAVDIAPYPIDWDDIRRFDRLSGVISGIAWTKGIEIRWGGDWDRDWDLQDNRFNDLPHFELVDEEPVV